MFEGIGTDILRVERMRGCLDSPSPTFMRRTFTESERREGESRPDRGVYYAKLFAAKEAVFKCFGISAESLGSWKNIEILDSDERQPQVKLDGSMAAIAGERGVRRILLSVSHDTDYVIAVAALVGEDEHGD